MASGGKRPNTGRPKGLPRTAKYARVGCSITKCDKPHKSKGWCADHYEYWRRHGDPLIPKPPKTRMCIGDCGTVLIGNPRQKRCGPCRRAMHNRASLAWRERARTNPEYLEAQRERAARQYNSDPEQNRFHMRERAKRVHLTDKLAALERYGGSKCECCGETDYRFLTFQHSNGDGAAHRKALTGNPRGVTSMWLRRLRRAGWPDVPGLTVLCANCHLAEDLWGGCPHKERCIQEIVIA